MKNIYIDMVGDLFHYGHINALQVCKTYGDYLIVGIHNDKTVESYKRTPIMNMNERIRIIESCKYVDKIIGDAPLKVTLDYIKKHNIDFVCVPDNRRDVCFS
jgi:cytidyltransferase-like protein